MRTKKGMLLIFALLLCWFMPTQIAWAQADSDVTFETLAMTYPQNKKIKVPIIGTERFAKNIKGEATIERRKSVTLIELNIGRLPPPSQLGPAFTTYVMWAITPEGIASNLGEYRQRDNETLDNWLGSEVRTSTLHQTFSLIITAEPYYLVSSPSRLVVVANQGGRDTGLAGAPNRISFSGDSDFEHVLVSPEPPAAKKDNKYPVELLQAHRALDIARYYEAENFAQNLLARAKDTVDRSDRAYQAGNSDNARVLANEAVRIADQARRLAVSRRKAEQQRTQIADKDEAITRLEDDVRSKTQSVTQMQAQLEEEKRRRRTIEQENDRLTKDVELAKREVNLEKDSRAMDRTLVTKLESENQQLKEALQKAEKNALVANRDQQLQGQKENIYRQYENRRESRGTVLIIPDDVFDGETSTEISVNGSFKLNQLADLLKQMSNNIVLESFTDNAGSPDSRFKFTQARAQTLITYLVGHGVSADRIQIFANGGSNPRGDNRNPQGRAANRRIELVVMETSTNGAS